MNLQQIQEVEEGNNILENLIYDRNTKTGQTLGESNLQHNECGDNFTLMKQRIRLLENDMIKIMTDMTTTIQQSYYNTN